MRSVAVRVPRSSVELAPVLESAKFWMGMLHEHGDDEIAVMVWNDCWRGVMYPGRPRADDHPSVSQVHFVVRCALASARAERAIALREEREAELGIEGLAAQGVLAGMLEAAQRKGWSAEKAMARAQQIAEAVSYTQSYEELIRGSSWNAGRLEPLRIGTVVWMPAIRRGALLGRSRQLRVSLDPRPWAGMAGRRDAAPRGWPGSRPSEG